jgi:putative transposase
VAAEAAMKCFGVSQRRACELIDVSRTVIQYKAKISELNETLRKKLRVLSAKHKRWGVWMMNRILRRDGFHVNHKRIERLYRLEGLSLRIRRRKKLRAVSRMDIPVATQPNERWCMDFVHDKLWNGRGIRCLTLVDKFTRECLALEVDISLGGERVKRVLERLATLRGLPKSITVDNGPEFISRVMDEWAYRNGVELAFSRPGKPTDNAYIESFNGKFRGECLNSHYFSTLAEAKLIIENWRIEYNSLRPHRSLKGLTPDHVFKNFTGITNLEVA